MSLTCAPASALTRAFVGRLNWADADPINANATAVTAIARDFEKRCMLYRLSLLILIEFTVFNLLKNV
ncbi:hypothetical protein R80B4_02546 [Fibrobacteres bacterium R8-0-B4]